MRRPSSQRWPLVLDRGPTSEIARGRRLGAAGFGVALLSAAAFPDLAIPILVRVVLGLAGLAPIAWAIFAGRKKTTASGTYVEADAGGLTRVTPDTTKGIIAWDAPFGVTLLASYGRATALLAFTTPTQTRYVPTRIDDRSETEDELLARIAVLADLDLVDGVAHDAALTSAAAASILREIAERDRNALGRVFLSDGRGVPISLDRATLAVGDRTFDLTSAVEWRPLMFHESTGQAAALYQATWIRQGGSEVVLVAPMPASIVPRESNAHREASGKLGRALTRDLRLLQAPAEPPPARDARVAIDRPFMMAVRRVLDDAPLAARVTAEPPPRPATERRLQ
ncbi:MAG: hypothetical protein JST00_17155 [Deltaproteobacteria bacterium]|nr:hypothetical protein [Deltaproteobacteria bacterium]